MNEYKLKKLVEKLLKNGGKITSADEEEKKEIEKLKKSKTMRLLLKNPRFFTKKFSEAFKGSNFTNEEIAALYTFVLAFCDNNVIETSKALAYILSHKECKKKFLRGWKEDDAAAVRECLVEAAKKRNLKRLKKNLVIED